ncbi:MAG: prolyl oligopeptidase family serine peptidase [Sphaerochaetaceae bacterium]|nr:prolyl oligopeptidase family serine peptidase [Sphaerochaetaceae bacterium]
MKKMYMPLIIVVAALVVSMIGSYLVQTNFLSVKQIDVTCTMNELVAQIDANNTKYGKDLGATLSKGSAQQISMTVYKPKNASESNPVPCIVCAHGWNNSKEMQIQNFVELSKRGFAVVTVDLAGHGHSDMVSDESGWGGGNTEGCLAAIEYAMSLGYVDASKIGTIGHSAGDLGLAYAIEQTNVAGSKKPVAAFCDAAGAIAAMIMSFNPSLDKSGLLLDVQFGKYEEMGGWGFDLENNSMAKMIFNAFSGGNSVVGDAKLPINEYYNETGKIATPEPGQQLSTNHGVIMRDPKVTHPGAVISTEVAAYSIDFFYACFGTPSGAKYIPSSRQSWPIGVFFQLVGLLAFFASAFVFGDLLLKTKRFSCLNSVVKEGSELPEITTWKEYVPLLVTFIPLAIFAFTMYFPCFAKGQTLIQSNNITPVVSGVVWYTAVSGAIAFAMIGVNYIAKRLCHLQDGETVVSLMSYGKVESISKFMKQALLAIEVVLLMYVSCVIAYYVFGFNFGISVYAVGVPRLVWLPEVLMKYLPFYLVFTVSSAMLNAGCRFNKIPEWATTAFVILASLLPVAILIIVNYATLFKTGVTLYESGDPSIFAWNLLGPMVFGGLVNRYYYKKTGNIWTGAIISALVLVLMATTVTRHTSDIAFFF